MFSFDFAGTGNSVGKYISLGWYESLDLIVILGQLKKMQKITKIALWGRSMGAVTALMYAG